MSPTNHTAHLRPAAVRSPLESSVSRACFAAQARILDRLNNLETLEFRMPEIEGFVGTRAPMRRAELLGLGPSGEQLPADPNRVGGIERMVLALRAAQ